MNREKSEYRVGVGASSVLMILVVLALTALSLLALSSARDTEALSRRNQSMVVDYYEAAADAQLRLMEADQWLAAARAAADGGVDFEQALADALPEGFSLTDYGFAFQQSAGDDRVILVEADIAPPGQPGPRYTVTRHQSIGTAPFASENEFTLIGE